MLFIGAVFFTFAPIGLLMISTLAPERGWLGIIVLLLLGGLAAVSWVLTFSISWKFGLGIVAFTGGFIAVHMEPMAGWLGLPGGAPTPIGVGLSLAVIAGYILFLTLILGQGRRMIAMGEEMRLAREIHDTLVPAVSQTIGKIEVHGVSIPSTAMGGDLIDVIQHAGGIDCVLADVSGHGVKAGIVMGMVKASIRTSLLSAESLSGVAGDLNTILCDTLATQLFVTAAIVRFLPDGKRAEVLLAGHHPVVRVARNGIVEEIPNDHIMLGVLDGEKFTPRVVELSPGDLLVSYTDGLSECIDAKGVMLGHDALVKRMAALREHGLKEIAEGLFKSSESHGVTDDDRSILLMRVHE
jgi:serine phosphatase RsbU (regulator of sigma subunit)